MAHPTEKLFVKCFQIELDFRSVVFPLREDNVKKNNNKCQFHHGFAAFLFLRKLLYCS